MFLILVEHLIFMVGERVWMIERAKSKLLPAAVTYSPVELPNVMGS